MRCDAVYGAGGEEEEGRRMTSGKGECERDLLPRLGIYSGRRWMEIDGDGGAYLHTGYRSSGHCHLIIIDRVSWSPSSVEGACGSCGCEYALQMHHSLSIAVFIFMHCYRWEGGGGWGKFIDGGKVVSNCWR